MRNALSALAAALVLAAAAAFRPAPQPTEGTWTIGTDRSDGQLQMNLTYGHTSNWGRGVPRQDLVGLTDEQINAPAQVPVAFRIQREPGTFSMQGFFHQGHGAGDFTFAPNRQFAAGLRSAGISGDIDDENLMNLALADMTQARARELNAIMGRLTAQDLVKLGIFDITPEYVRGLRSLSIEGTNTAEGVVELKIARITPQYVHDMERAGYRNLTRRQLVEMGIQRVDAGFVAEVQRMGFHDPTPAELVQLRIFRVTPEVVSGLRSAGFTDLTPQGVVEMQIHHITPEYVHALADLGYRNLSRDMLMQMGIQGVTPDFIRQVRAAGFTNVPPETLVKMKIFGIGVNDLHEANVQ